MPKYPQITTLPDTPYYPDEIRAFAHHNLRVVIEGKTRHNRNYRNAVEYYASIIEELPPAFQIILMAMHRPTIMAPPDEVSALFRQINSDSSADVLGFFLPGHSDKWGETPVCWGGIFETRERPPSARAPDATFLHEHSHRIDHLLAVRHAGMGVLEKNTKYMSYLPEWQETVKKHTHTLERAQRTASWAQDARLYPGIRRLVGHLTMPARWAEDDPTHYDRIESFAEMSTHYAALYKMQAGNLPEVNRRLTHAYPTFWPAYRDHMLPLIDEEALRLLNDVQKAKRQIVYYEQQIARRLGREIDPLSFKAPLRHAELEGGLPTLRTLAQEARTRYEQTPCIPPSAILTDTCMHQGSLAAPLATSRKTR